MKNLLLLIFIFFTGIELHAQTTYTKGFKPGIRLGMNRANFSNLSIFDFGSQRNRDEKIYTSKTDYYVGIFAGLRLSKKFALEPEVNYSRQGAKYVESFFGKVELNYINIGLVSKFYLMEGFHLMVGSNLGIPLNIERNSNTFFSTGPLNGLDPTVVIGFGYEMPSNIIIEFRIKQGLGNTRSFSGGFGFRTGYNRVMQLGAAYQFVLSKNK